MIRFEGISKTYKNGVRALEEVDFEVKDGEFVFLIGPSGAGKTTLFKILYGEERPDAGEVYFGETSVRSLNRNELSLLRRKMGIIFQDFKLLPTSSVFENVALVLEVLGIAPTEIEEKVAKALELVGLVGKERSFPWQISGGERQRVAVARAIVANPVLILADEPTAEVDPTLTWGLMEIFERINKLGTTIMIATHDSEIVNSMKKRVAKLDSGRLVKDDKKGNYV